MTKEMKKDLKQNAYCVINSEREKSFFFFNDSPFLSLTLPTSIYD